MHFAGQNRKFLKVAIVKYNAGNTQSVIYALNRLGVDPLVTDNEEELRGADKVIFPGVGEASSAMRYLKANNLDKLLPSLRQPVLGICLGLQLMCRYSEENDIDCLGIFPIDVKRFPAGKDKVPHMGWNTVSNLQGLLFEGVRDKDFVYFVHSYYAALSPYTVASTEYILPYSSALHKDNFYAVQFHPEKSGSVGERIVTNFIDLKN